MILILTYKAIEECIETEESKFPDSEYQLGELYYVYHPYKDVKKKEVCGYEFTNDESLAFPIPEGSIAKQMVDECGDHIVVTNTPLENYIRQGERLSHYINCKKKNSWKIYTFK